MNPTPDEEAIFLSALELPSPDDRAAYLTTACSGDDVVRTRVEALLAAAVDDAFLNTPPALAAGNTQVMRFSHKSEGVGTQFDRYRLLEKIGEGGFADVYRAEQLEPVRREVAVKIIKPGMDSRQVIARFEAERQALAMMDHPNIAKIFDAGTTGGEMRIADCGLQNDEEQIPNPKSPIPNQS